MKIGANHPFVATELRGKAEGLLGKEESGVSHPLAGEDSGRLVHELRVHQIELELQNEELRQARDTLEEARDQYRDLYDRAPAGYLTLDEKGIIRQVNQTMARMISTELGNLLGQSLYQFVEQEQRGALLRHLNSVTEANAQHDLETILLKKDGSKFPAQMESSLLSPADGGRRFRIVLIDISRLKAAEGQLRQANERLESEVRVRTSDLIATNKALQEEIEQRKQAMVELDQRKSALEAKTAQLEEANIALRVMFHQGEEYRESLESNIMEQVHKLLIPCLRDVLSSNLGAEQRLGIETALSHLANITSSFAKKLGGPDYGLTARELKICSMINRGLSSKEIAASLNMSMDTVSFHRRNIRRKLGINDTNTSLSIHLRSFV